VPVPESEHRLTEPLLTELVAGLDDWSLQNGTAITKTFSFADFRTAVGFVDRVAMAAEAAQHHPDLHLERYKTVRIVLTTHATGGVSAADIELAGAIDRLLG
jgi:4a-hydroxytetrahydrobiopterin dehydratase